MQDRARLLALLAEVAAGRASPAAALERMAWLPIEEVTARNGQDREHADAAFARVDHHRGVRNGFPEVVFCERKTVEQTVAICGRLAERGSGFLATRASAAQQDALVTAFPDANANEIGRTVWLRGDTPPEPKDGVVLIMSAGTSDLPVAEEAAVTAEAFGNVVERLYDVGVAGLHRLLSQSAVFERARVLIVVAGMEGALPSVVGGLVRVPVIAVPTSVGYGASFGGIAALLSMLNSCAAGITVVNIDNGFGAACAATRITQILAPIS